jgi:hypothetical protein
MQVPNFTKSVSIDKSLTKKNELVYVKANEDLLEQGTYNFWIEEYIDKDDKAKIRYIKNIESLVRSSIELRSLFKYLKDELKLNECSILNGVTTNNASIELHHYPFTLFDIVDIVSKKRRLRDEDLNPISVSEEVVKIHYKKMIGLVALSKTAHELAHSGNLLIKPEQIFGNVKLFMEEYNCGLSGDQIDNVRVLFSSDFRNKASELNLHIFSKNFITWKDSTELDEKKENENLEE